ncbi:DeoR/GlpR family DNA-binding transcription regulator [Oribacterium sp. HCP28S3_H8]|uniref:DeoR/GlpR family DNA-binding transcription regulator n=1 Tax=Oribacterium sp. HCP28S3_H8 TaxID=3438945 RepID=UPI003F89D431
MLLKERQDMILDLIQKKGIVHTADLKERLNVSSETIRKDLELLSQDGMVLRVHGGAIPGPNFMKESSSETTLEYIPLEERDIRHREEKLRIVQAAASMVHEHQIIGLDYGSTSQLMALELLRQFQALTIITDSIQNAMVLARNPHFTIILPGGVLNNDEYSIVNDISPLLSHLHIDTYFMSATGVDPVVGCTDQRLNEVKMQIQFLKISSRTIVLADSSKFGSASLAKICDLNDISLFITDSGLSDNMRAAIQDSGVPIKLV